MDVEPTNRDRTCAYSRTRRGCLGTISSCEGSVIESLRKGTEPMMSLVGTEKQGEQAMLEASEDVTSLDSREKDLIERRKAFGEWLRNCRRQAHITQAELAKSLDYDSSQLISNIERGVSLLPSRRIPDFARALGCSLIEMEVRYFQCSARNTSESRMPDLLLKYLPLIEALEYGKGSDEEILTAIRGSRVTSR